MTTDIQKPTLTEKSGYFAGAGMLLVYYIMFSMFLPYFYTDIFGISAAAMGTMLLVTRLWDSANDIICGLLTDRTRSRWGNFRPWLLFGSIPFAVVAVLTFCTPDLPPIWKLVYAYITYTLAGMGYTALEIPLNSLMGSSSEDSTARTSVVTYKTAGVYVGCMIAQALTVRLVSLYGGEANPQRGYFLTAASYSVFLVLAMVYAFKVTKQRVTDTGAQNRSTKESVKQLFRTGPWWAVTVAAVAWLTSVSLRNAGIMYYFKYNVGNEGLASAFMLTGSIACMIGLPFMKPWSDKIGKRNLAMILLGIFSIAQVVQFFVSPQQTIAIFVIHFIVAASNGPAFVLAYAMFADIADYMEDQSGRRDTGLVYSAGSFAFKFGWTLSGALLGLVLQWSGFVPNAVQSASATSGIDLIMSLIPAGLGCISVAALFFYKLNKREMEEIDARLHSRRVQGQ